MRYHEFLEGVRRRAGLETSQEALDAVHVTFTVLGERLDRPDRERLAAPLPNELKSYLLEWKAPEGNLFSLEEFYSRVGARAGVRYREALGLAQAVISVLLDTASPQDVQVILAKLPGEYSALFRKKSHSPLSASA